MVAFLAFGFGLSVGEGLEGVLVAVIAGPAVGVAAGYLYFRSRGRLFGDSPEAKRFG